MLNNLPRWAWWVIGWCIVLVVVVLLKVNMTLGSNGFTVTQGLVK
jgi:hypothetical protein